MDDNAISGNRGYLGDYQLRAWSYAGVMTGVSAWVAVRMSLRIGVADMKVLAQYVYWLSTYE